jgi:hypothetical protein
LIILLIAVVIFLIVDIAALPLVLTYKVRT